MRAFPSKIPLLLLPLFLLAGSPRDTCWAAPSAPTLPADAAKVARDFLLAFTTNDRPAIKRMLPADCARLYGPCPFARMPYLTNIRVDGRVAAIDFQGPMTDSGLPDRGTIVFRLVEEDGLRCWRVRQLYWYKELPPEADLPDSSPTDSDRRQEPKVRQATLDFIHYWLVADYQQMDRLTFHWWEVPRRPPGWVKFRGADLRASPTTLDGLRVDFVVKLRVASLLPKSVRGNLWLVKENGDWRVRPLTFAFFF
jgi:hypothetical protein